MTLIAVYRHLPTPLVVLEDIDGEIVVGRALRTVSKGEQGAVVVEGFDVHDGSVPDLHANPVAGPQFVNAFEGHAHPPLIDAARAPTRCGIQRP
jgi:hypothetical protein